MPGEEEKDISTPLPFGVEEEVVNGVRLIAVCGELDLSSAPQLEERLETTLASDKLALAIDLANCEFIDSTGIGLIVRTWQRLDPGPDGKGDSRFALCGLGHQVSRLLEITGLDSSIRTYGSRDEAIAELGND